VRALLVLAERTYGGVDVLLNSAGYSDPPLAAWTCLDKPVEER
jgi:hypothetical protein